MSLLDQCSEAVGVLRRAAAVEAACLEGRDALALLKLSIEAERVVASLRHAVVVRVEDSNVWRGEGDASFPHFLARLSGTTVSSAIGTVRAAEDLQSAPATAEALRSGQISETQARALAPAVVADPAAEAGLLDKAGQLSVNKLRDECVRVKAAASDDETQHAAIRANRHLRFWSDAAGAACFAGRTTPEQGARIKSALEPWMDAQFAQAKGEGRRESADAYAIDALEAALTGSGEAPKARRKARKPEVLVVVDHAALLRGHTIAGETCEIAGVGPVPVSVANDMLADCYLRLIVRDGVDVKAVTRKSRYVDARQRAALAMAGHGRCEVKRCGATGPLEIDHIKPVSEGGETCLENNWWPCRWHHYLKTYCGWKVVGPPGDRDLVPPDDDRDGRGPP